MYYEGIGESRMNDIFIERMVKKNMDGKDIAIIAGILVLASLILLASIIFLMPSFGPFVPFIVLVGVVFGGYKLIATRNLEFEYSNTNGYITVDKIMNKETRKRLMTFECRDVEEIGKYKENEQRLQNKPVDTKLFASQMSDGTDAWYIIVRAQKTGKTLLAFSPDEDFLESVKRFIPKQLKFEAFGR